MIETFDTNRVGDGDLKNATMSEIGSSNQKQANSSRKVKSANNSSEYSDYVTIELPLSTSLTSSPPLQVEKQDQEHQKQPTSQLVSHPVPGFFHCNNDPIIIDDVPNKLYSNDVASSLKVQKLCEMMISTNNKVPHQETEALNSSSYFDFLDDFVRFDISRTGIPCFSGYSVSVQYEDDFLVGKAGTPCYLNNMICSNKSRIRLWHDEKAFEVVYKPRASCSRPKNCIYQVKLPHKEDPVGTIHFKQDLVHIYNAFEKCLSVRRKQGSSFYSIKTESGDRLASVELFRGLRGDILYYGLSILGDASAVDKALLIGLTIAMDIRQRESEMRCSLIWVPLSCIIVIGLFSLLPWLYFYEENNAE